MKPTEVQGKGSKVAAAANRERHLTAAGRNPGAGALTAVLVPVAAVVLLLSLVVERQKSDRTETEVHLIAEPRREYTSLRAHATTA